MKIELKESPDGITELWVYGGKYREYILHHEEFPRGNEEPIANDLATAFFVEDMGRMKVVVVCEEGIFESEKYREVWELEFEQGAVTYWGIDWDDFEFWYSFNPDRKSSQPFRFVTHVVDMEDGPVGKV